MAKKVEEWRELVRWHWAGGAGCQYWVGLFSCLFYKRKKGDAQEEKIACRVRVAFPCIIACWFRSGRSSILLTHLKTFPSFDLFKAPLSGHWLMEHYANWGSLWLPASNQKTARKPQEDRKDQKRVCWKACNTTTLGKKMLIRIISS